MFRTVLVVSPLLMSRKCYNLINPWSFAATVGIRHLNLDPRPQQILSVERTDCRVRTFGSAVARIPALLVTDALCLDEVPEPAECVLDDGGVWEIN